MKGIIIALIVVWLISKITKVNKEPVTQSSSKEEEMTVDTDSDFNQRNDAPNVNYIIKEENKVAFDENKTKNRECKTKNHERETTLCKDVKTFDLKRAVIYSSILNRPFK